MQRYTPEVRDGVLFLVCGDEEIKIGSLDDIVATVGGEIYQIEYGERQQNQPWLDTNDSELKIDIRDAVTEIPHKKEFATNIAKYDMSTDRYGLARRTVEFANEFVNILDKQGKK